MPILEVEHILSNPPSGNPPSPPPVIQCRGNEFLGFSFAKDDRTGWLYLLRAQATQLSAHRSNFPFAMAFDVFGTKPVPHEGSKLTLVPGVVPTVQTDPFRSFVTLVDPFRTSGSNIDPSTLFPFNSEGQATAELEKVMSRYFEPFWVAGDVLEQHEALQRIQTAPHLFIGNALPSPR